jgi:hypothetical protein
VKEAMEKLEALKAQKGNVTNDELRDYLNPLWKGQEFEQSGEVLNEIF